MFVEVVLYIRFNINERFFAGFYRSNPYCKLI